MSGNVSHNGWASRLQILWLKRPDCLHQQSCVLRSHSRCLILLSGMLFTANEDPKMNTFYIPVSWTQRSFDSPWCLPTLWVFVRSNSSVCSQSGHFQLCSWVCLSAAVTAMFLFCFFSPLGLCVHVRACGCAHVLFASSASLSAALSVDSLLLVICDRSDHAAHNKQWGKLGQFVQNYMFIFKSIPHVVEGVFFF